MNPQDTDRKYVSASAPVNRRTARVADSETPPGPLASARQKKAAARALLGPPLADRLQAAQPASPDATRGSPLGAGRIVQALLATASGCGVVLGALQSSLALGAAGAAGLIGAATWAVADTLRRRRATTVRKAAALPAFDGDMLRRLDDLCDAIAPDLPREVCAQLVDLKDRFARIAGLLERTDVDEQFTSDDRMYLIESLRRYLPDTLLAYLAVPAAHRHDQPLDGGGTAAALLAGQLGLLQSELQAREDKLARAAGAALLRQQRFLQSKMVGRGD